MTWGFQKAVENKNAVGQRCRKCLGDSRVPRLVGRALHAAANYHLTSARAAYPIHGIPGWRSKTLPCSARRTLLRLGWSY